jgi:hypothetical protein
LHTEQRLVYAQEEGGAVKEESRATGVTATEFPECFWYQMGTAEERGVQGDRKVAQIKFLIKIRN